MAKRKQYRDRLARRAASWGEHLIVLADALERGEGEASIQISTRRTTTVKTKIEILTSALEAVTEEWKRAQQDARAVQLRADLKAALTYAKTLRTTAHAQAKRIRDEESRAYHEQDADELAEKWLRSILASTALTKPEINKAISRFRKRFTPTVVARLTAGDLLRRLGYAPTGDALRQQLTGGTASAPIQSAITVDKVDRKSETAFRRQAKKNPQQT